MLASFPASMVNQKYDDLGIPNRFRLNSSRSNGWRRRAEISGNQRKPLIRSSFFVARFAP